MEIASVEGLEGLTIGRVASEMDMSKSALFARFGSKEALQVATVEAAGAVLDREVVGPAHARAPGLDRLRGLTENYLGYLQEQIFPGGCLLAAAGLEFDSRPGAVRDAIERASASWSAELEREAARAGEAGELPSSADAAQVAFELNAILNQANASYQLVRDRRVFERARRAVARVLA
jgi:AcrR family transcriptional regulator